MIEVDSKRIVDDANHLIMNYGISPYNAYIMVYEKSAEMEELNNRIQQTKQSLHREMKKRKMMMKCIKRR